MIRIVLGIFGVAAIVIIGFCVVCCLALIDAGPEFFRRK